MPILKYYILSILYITILGITLSLILSSISGDNHLLLLGIMGTGIAVSCCACVNLLYFFPFQKNIYRFITPGLISIFLILFEFKNSIPDLLFFEFYALVNLVLGIIWNIKFTRLKKDPLKR